ncbi:MAG TPA: peptidase domain-containing ABC transporter [Rhodocyclaceae bacterium]|uniref:peptidase domain-containing ABC transporter n=2 Tax=Zoogloea sp. TaxID=49181 RepID=UPI002CE23805|nr:peptidase domain-containing ABC transporter [Zoogloea sp.]HMZ75529.1 peptidase domain-containing ABC transporter [Rhodocyclaceae bacterium]HNA66758.1 peptidase domain-containing ABC transporter [Rhodocyclaceae bacterium]HNF62754.1 peptidase domain-containing ABC transporter [Rhodocyclaceae bacterium]HNH17254.1 peptidase domain-containing ABC transporter [Zoogloea sp.]
MLDFGFASRTPLILQGESAECGLACLAMVAGHHGHRIDLASLRARHSLSQRGVTLADLMRIAGTLHLAPRPLRLEPEQLGQLRLPCVLHWDLNHFVVLIRLRGDRASVHDPACGARTLRLAELSRHFTGVALELNPTDAFTPATERRRVRLGQLVGPLRGLGGSVLQALVLALVLQLFALLAPFYMQWVVDQALVTQDRDLVTVLGVGFLLLALVNAGVAALRGWVLMVLGTSLNLAMLTRLFRHLIRLPMTWFDKRHLGDVVSRFESLNSIQRTLTGGFLEALVDGAMALLTLAMMLFYSLPLASVAIVAAAAYAGLRAALYQPQRRAAEAHIVRGARQHSHFLETVRGIQTLRLHAHEEPRTVAWHNLAVDQFNAGIRSQRLGLLYQGLNTLLFGIENVVTVWLGARLVLDTASGAGFSVGMLFAFIAYKNQFVQRMAAFIEKALELRMLGLHAERVGDIALAAAEPDEPPASAAAAPLAGHLSVRNLAFRYGDTDPRVLDDVSFDVRAGESVALVGPSGGGKTTLVKLLLGLMTPESGGIEVDGVPLARFGLRRYREQVASVMQDDQLFAGSLADNIAFFDPQADPTRIEACARLAAVHDDIAAMPMGYHTLVGDMGTVLSGGQKQRVLLARALYRRPRILVLDEATSHLDIARERCVNDAIRGLPLTRLIVAHRPETIASCDRVIVLTGGRVTNEMYAVAGGMGGAG